jgi:hypothetical protein
MICENCGKEMQIGYGMAGGGGLGPYFFCEDCEVLEKFQESELQQGKVNMSEQRHGSIGAQRVRESFNPSKDDTVDRIKRYTADLIDLCEDLKRFDGRLAALAQTAYEEAAMWAVKAATTPKTS